MEIFSPFLLIAFGLLQTCYLLRNSYRERRRWRELQRVACAVARRFDLAVEPAREHFRLHGTLDGRSVEASIYDTHCRARASFVEQLLPERAIVSIEQADHRALLPLQVARGELPAWLLLPLHAHARQGLTLYADRLSLLAHERSTARTVVEALVEAASVAAALERARPEARLR
ncbi:MAG: hypothetical protein KC503_38615 [Myxococcales bacterium]|nr:hypothetical protein [Myxococcales bacterium]